MDDFSPAGVARQVPALKMLLEAREQLSNLQKYMDGKVNAEQQLKKLLSDPKLMAALEKRRTESSADGESDRRQGIVGRAAVSRAWRDQGGSRFLRTQMASELQTEQRGGQTTEVDEFASLLKQSFKPRSERAETEIDNAVNTLVKQALADQSLIKDDVLDTIEEMIARLDEKLSIQINEIIHAEEFQKLESAWRGLYYLTNHSETDATLKIRVMNISKQELYREAKAYPDAKWDQSPLFKKLYEAEFGQLGGQPYGALVGDYQFNHSAVDVTVMKSVSKVCAAAHCMFIAGADPTLMGMDSWTELSNPRDLSKIFETPDYAAWKSLRDSENSRYLGLCMPRVLSREPYGAKTNPVEEFAFEERTDGHAGKDYAWMNAAYAMAANINRAFKEYGWTVRIRGVQSGGEVIDLPVHTFPTDRRQRRPEVPDRDRHHRPARGGAFEVRPAAADPSQEHRQGGLHRRPVGLPAEELRRKGRDGRRQSLRTYSLHVRRVPFRPLPQGHGARLGRRELRAGAVAAQAADLDQPIRGRRPRQRQRSRQGPQAACGGQGRGVRRRGESGLLCDALLPAAAFPA